KSCRAAETTDDQPVGIEPLTPKLSCLCGDLSSDLVRRRLAGNRLGMLLDWFRADGQGPGRHFVSFGAVRASTCDIN
ncbi:MAG: hypothetical protein ACKOEM_01470, partial [Planctomycetia bacterium]